MPNLASVYDRATSASAAFFHVLITTSSLTINEETQLVTENESVYIPIGAVHALENPGKIPLELIEVQSGAYLGEDDIVRFSDRYGRIAK